MISFCLKGTNPLHCTSALFHVSIQTLSKPKLLFFLNSFSWFPVCCLFLEQLGFCFKSMQNATSFVFCWCHGFSLMSSSYFLCVWFQACTRGSLGSQWILNKKVARAIEKTLGSTFCHQKKWVKYSTQWGPACVFILHYFYSFLIFPKCCLCLTI